MGKAVEDVHPEVTEKDLAQIKQQHNKLFK